MTETKKLDWLKLSERERNCLVAEKVMWWTRHPDKMHPTDNRTINDVLYCAPGYEGYNGGSAGQFNVVPAFSTDISAAFKIVDKMKERGFGFALTNDYLGANRCRFYRLDDTIFTGFTADKLPIPECISLAALRAVGVEI